MFRAQFVHARGDAIHELLGDGDIAGGLHIGGKHLGKGRVVVGADRLVEGNRLIPFAAPPIPVAVAGQIGRDLIEPGGKSGVASEIHETPVGADKRILGNLLRVLLVAEKLVNHSINAVPIPAHHLVKGGLVAVFKTVYEQAVEGYFLSFRGHKF